MTQRKDSMNSIGLQLQNKGYNKNKKQNSALTSNLRLQSSFSQDGVDHINIDPQGETDIGKFLAFDAPYVFTIPHYGRFTSIMAMWAYLTTKGHPNFIRTLSDRRLREFIRERDASGRYFDHPEVQYICAYVLADKVMNDPAVIDTLCSVMGAPFRSYFFLNGYEHNHHQREWWLDVCDCLRDDVFHKEEPLMLDFSNGAKNFEQACVPLDCSLIGSIVRTEPEPVKPAKATKTAKKPETVEKTPVPKKDKDEQKPAKKRQKPIPRAWGETPVHKGFTVAELDTNELNTRVLKVADKKEFGELFLTLQKSSPEDIKKLVMDVHPLQSILMSLKGDIGPEDATAEFIMTFDPVTYSFVGLATAEFNNPLIADDTLEELSFDVPDVTDEEVHEAVRMAAGVPEETPCRIYVVKPSAVIEEEPQSLVEEILNMAIPAVEDSVV